MSALGEINGITIKLRQINITSEKYYRATSDSAVYGFHLGCRYDYVQNKYRWLHEIQEQL